MSKLDEKDKLIALAYLHQGKTPKEVEELCPNVSYAQALRLRKELDEAIKEGELSALFDIGEAALESLLENVRGDLGAAVEVLTGDPEALEGELMTISKNVQGMQLLEAELTEATREVLKRMRLIAVSTSNAETLIMLAEAMAKLQTAFFKSSNIQVANFNNGSGFEKFLQP